MQSKEEIEDMKKYFSECIIKDTVYEEELTINCIKVANEYIEQLETEKQELIEKLEEDIKVFSNYEERKQMCREQLFENDGKWFYAGEILKIVKGENDE